MVAQVDYYSTWAANALANSLQKANYGSNWRLSSEQVGGAECSFVCHVPGPRDNTLDYFFAPAGHRLNVFLRRRAQRIDNNRYIPCKALQLPMETTNSTVLTPISSYLTPVLPSLIAFYFILILLHIITHTTASTISPLSLQPHQGAGGELLNSLCAK